MAEGNIEPSLEAKTTDGNTVFTPKQSLERLRHFCKREHQIDIASSLKRENATDTVGTGKEQTTQENFIWGMGPEPLYIVTRAEYKTEPGRIKRKEKNALTNRVLHVATYYLSRPR